MQKSLTSFLFILFLTFPVAALTQIEFKNSEEAIKYRKAAFQLIATHFSQMQPVITGKATYDSIQLKDNVEILKILIRLPWSGFNLRAEGGSSLPKIWDEFSEFEKKQEDLMVHVDQMSEAIYSDNLKDIQFFFKKTALSCKTCHNSFKKKE